MKVFHRATKDDLCSKNAGTSMFDDTVSEVRTDPTASHMPTQVGEVPHLHGGTSPQPQGTGKTTTMRNYPFLRSFLQSAPGPSGFGMNRDDPDCGPFRDIATVVCSPSQLRQEAGERHVGNLRLQLQNVTHARIEAKSRGDLDTYTLLASREAILRAQVSAHPSTPAWARSSSRRGPSAIRKVWGRLLGGLARPSSLPMWFWVGYASVTWILFTFLIA